MSFFTNAIDVLQTLVIALGGGLCVWGGINLLEGYGQDNPASNAHVRQRSTTNKTDTDSRPTIPYSKGRKKNDGLSYRNHLNTQEAL